MPASMPLPVSSTDFYGLIEHGAIGHPQVEATRDILLYAQQRDPLKMPVAYPVHAAGSVGKAMGT